MTEPRKRPASRTRRARTVTPRSRPSRADDLQPKPGGEIADHESAPPEHFRLHDVAYDPEFGVIRGEAEALPAAFGGMGRGHHFVTVYVATKSDYDEQTRQYVLNPDGKFWDFYVGRTENIDFFEPSVHQRFEVSVSTAVARGAREFMVSSTGSNPSMSDMLYLVNIETGEVTKDNPGIAGQGA